jgi:hypothetical protein
MPVSPKSAVHLAALARQLKWMLHFRRRTPEHAGRFRKPGSHQTSNGKLIANRTRRRLFASLPLNSTPDHSRLSRDRSLGVSICRPHCCDLHCLASASFHGRANLTGSGPVPRTACPRPNLLTRDD